MLNQLRHCAEGIIAKILMAFLLLSFVIWGIGDIFRSGAGGATIVATVGGRKITTAEYQHALRYKMEQLSEQLGKAFNPALLKQLGIGIMVREEMINHALVSNEASNMGLNASDDALIAEIYKNPAFFDKDGHFDKNIYLATLKARNLSEVTYISELREDMATRLLAETVSNGLLVPNAFINYSYQAQQQQRVADIYQLSVSTIPAVQAASEAEIKNYYDSHSQHFMNPELRSISYMDIKLSDIQKKVEIDETAIKAVYEEHKADFHRPEQRDLEQMLFEKEADAKNASDMLKKGEKFASVAHNANLVNKDKTAMGLVAMQDLPSETGKQVFALKQGEISPVLKSDFGFHIFKVNKILPDRTLSLEEARPDIVRDLKQAKAQEQIAQIANQTIDNLAGGMNFEDAAGKINANITHLNDITHESKNTAIADYDTLITAGFSMNQGEHSQALPYGDGSYFIVKADKVKPASPKPLAEVKDKIAAILKQEKIQTSLKAKANDMVALLKAGKPVEGITPIISGAIKRTSEATENGKVKLPKILVSEIFKAKAGDVTAAYPATLNDYLFAKVEKILPANADAKNREAMEKVADTLKTELANESVDSYLRYLRKKQHVDINEAAFSSKEEE